MRLILTLVLFCGDSIDQLVGAASFEDIYVPIKFFIGQITADLPVVDFHV